MIINYLTFSNSFLKERKGTVIHHYSNFFYLTLFSYNHGTTLQALFEYLVEQSDN